ncbi:PDZ and LIM domain protein 7 isoform X1 [Pteropus vampyrus]|uniref:PDZ and LIM domain protein 7 n=2 Tax=Pteropus vampyrus TaxID=132908 RepID=A0A6P3Q9Y0_PTEVA|nr:PDZ and LIM domain protein 7 isoform X1 [Pteropus vampyrus]XP_011360488.1 PDZ and LIM domain protein 7 isoform X1 [Pteropus vampyrus]XP_011360489.1 PDZ and LIM domain protein 7 isoform X1 [Pteropus vampyrus]
MDSFKVVLEGPAPWGFRLQGGKDFNVPLSISRLTPGGKAAQAGLAVGDWVLSIDGENAGGLTHIEAQNKIRACGERLSLGLSRAQLAQSKPQKALAPATDSPRYTFAPSASLNKTARPFGAPPPSDSTLQQNGQPLRPLVPDASKQRLMEDTEDWRPRPGTGQSRSFRILAHLTGTEFMQDPDEEHLKKSSQVPRTEAPVPASATPQEPWPGPTTPSPTSRPPWAVDPAFAERYAPDKTSTVMTRHSQPATPTPLQNRTSIVQAAAGGGPGGCGGSNGKTPVCHQCHKVIRGRYLVALGHAYHPEEFVCSQCGTVLEEGGFFEEKGAIFCPPCYDVRYAPSCAKCKKKITGEIMHALKMTWHVHCFTCAACKTPIRNRAFYMEEGAPYCERGKGAWPGERGVVRAGENPVPPSSLPPFPQTMRRCLAQNAEAVTSRSMLETASWRRWASAGMTRASYVLYVRSIWKERLSTPRRTSPFARAMPSPTCEPLQSTAACPPSQMGHFLKSAPRIFG